MHNKYLTPQFFEDNNPILAKSAAQISYLKLEYTFLYLKFLITTLCNSCASTSYIFSLTPGPMFCQITYRP